MNFMFRIVTIWHNKDWQYRSKRLFYCSAFFSPGTDTPNDTKVKYGFLFPAPMVYRQFTFPLSFFLRFWRKCLRPCQWDSYRQFWWGAKRRNRRGRNWILYLRCQLIDKKMISKLFYFYYFFYYLDRYTIAYLYLDHLKKMAKKEAL